jgi:hypothetical protein
MKTGVLWETLPEGMLNLGAQVESERPLLNAEPYGTKTAHLH